MSHLYVFQADDGPVKIGISESPIKRARELELSMGRAITRRFASVDIAEPREIEQTLHRHFRDRRTVGEWFLVTFDEAVSAAKSLLAPVAAMGGQRSAEVVRAVDLSERYGALKSSGIGGQDALAGFAAALTDDDLQALAVTMRAMALEALEVFGLIASHLTEPTASGVRELIAGADRAIAEAAALFSSTPNPS